jgi:hypothetical protein
MQVDLAIIHKRTLPNLARGVTERRTMVGPNENYMTAWWCLWEPGKPALKLVPSPYIVRFEPRDLDLV